MTPARATLARATPAADAPGFVELVEEHGRAMVRLARGLVGRGVDAEDLVQDVLASALLQWPRVSSADEPRAYVTRMLVNAAMSWWRRPARRESPTRTGDPHEPGAGRTGSVAGAGFVGGADGRGDPATALADRDLLLRELRALPRRQRAVLVLRYYEGLTDVEVADLLGVATSTVRSNAARGLAAMRRRVPAETRKGAVARDR